MVEEQETREALKVGEMGLQDLVKINGIGELVEGLTIYSHRHATRLDRLIRTSHLLDYTLAACQVLQPPLLVSLLSGHNGHSHKGHNVLNPA